MNEERAVMVEEEAEVRMVVGQASAARVEAEGAGKVRGTGRSR